MQHTISQHQRLWGVDQWAAFLSNRPLPCMPCSKTLLAERQKVLGERLSARDLADIAGADPVLCLLLL